MSKGDCHLLNKEYKTRWTSYVYLKKRSKKKSLLFVLNFTPIERGDYRVGVPENKKYKLLLSADEKRFGGKKDLPSKKTFTAEKISWDGREYSIAYPLGAYEAVVFEF